jgi:hypothetical protein
MSIFGMNVFKFAVCFVVLNALTQDVRAWTAPLPVRQTETRLYHAPKNAPKHDVGGDPFGSLPEDQKERARAYMEHQQSVPKPGFPADVRSLVQYNHGFAVMSTNSKS